MTTLSRSIKNLANVLLARKPRFVVTGLPRSGTSYLSALCKANGVEVSHEKYFTKHGPMLRNPQRRFDTVGDVSWLAPPYLPDGDMVILHQVRHPLKVVNSIHQLGLFHSHRANDRLPFVERLAENFNFSSDPLHSALRFYVEWNERCEKLTDKRFSVEKLDQERSRIAEWIGIKLSNTATVAKDTNTRNPEVDEVVTLDKLSKFPEFKAFEDMARRYGYDLERVTS